MQTTAICCQSYRFSTRRAAGTTPLTSPPITLQTFNPACLNGAEFLYIKLHGLPNQPFWYGDDYLTALSANLVSQANLSGCVAFVASCHLPESPMLQALLDAGCKAVIGGSGLNYAGRHHITGADLLGLIFRRAYATTHNPVLAFKIAKGYLLTCNSRTKAFQDTFQFQLYTNQPDHRL